ncbi:MAG: bifunctional phosphoribosylaminoimidazolecarboxamide formyltransferase/IMP cyclohydrolase [Magnetococcales bacterium]|nr:bifunctional phosphoribosylaminoimidazolecarboxamide formyltransferase/IMP cyclohydrolase [Magnetococcales bacterium]
MATISRALISVSDKTGLASFAQGLAAQGVHLLSTGGTAQFLKNVGVSVMDVSQFTGFPEIMDGRVKTLHPKVHGALLGLRGHLSHERQMKEHGIRPIDMLVVNLYPFEETVAKPDCTLEQAIENIDIGGPSMLRSAAKNYRSVTVLTDPKDYGRVLAEMRLNGSAVSQATNAQLARKVFARTAAYDAAISNWLSALDEEDKPGLFPEVLTVQYKKEQEMRYGENPHQKAAFYTEANPSDVSSVSQARQLQGKELSFNNIHDANGAYELVKEFSDPAVVVVKHTNPCGVAVDPDLLAAYQKARDTDPTSSFGGIIACNRVVTKVMATEIASTFVEAVICPGFDVEAQEVLQAKSNLRLLVTPALGQGPAAPRTGRTPPEQMDMKRVVGGLLVQERDERILTEADLKVVTKRAPTDAEMQDLLFAWKVVKHVKSNAIVYVKDLCTVGIGAGQMSRVDSSRIAVWKGKETAKGFERAGNPIAGTVLASDAFFPFADGVEAAAEAGATAVIQPGGSIRDQEVIDAADRAGLAMVFTGFRHFKH